jgi:hypothetical protein
VLHSSPEVKSFPKPVLQQVLGLVDIAGMGKRRAGGSTRMLVFERRLVFLQRNRWRLFAMVAGYATLSAAIGFFVPAGWWSGAYWGAAVVGLLWAISWFVSLDGSFFARAGSWAEEWTSEALRKRATAFSVIDDFPLDGRNLDHVLVGPGGVFAVETKWKSKWRDRQHELRSLELERRQAAFQAEKLEEILEGLGLRVRVRPMLVVWGPGIPTDESFVGFGQVGVFVGDRWKDWPDRALSKDALLPEHVNAIRESLTGLVEVTADREQPAAVKGLRVARTLLTPSVHR